MGPQRRPKKRSKESPVKSLEKKARKNPRKKTPKIKGYRQELVDLVCEDLTEESIITRLYAFEGLHYHITNQIEISKTENNKYRRREMIRLQIAMGKIEELLEEGKNAAKVLFKNG